MRWGVPVSSTISIPTPSTMILVLEIRFQPPHVTPVPRRHFCTMLLYHVAPEVHFCGKYDEFLFNANLLFAWEVVLYEVHFLTPRLASRAKGDGSYNYQCVITPEAGQGSVIIIHPKRDTYNRCKVPVRLQTKHSSCFSRMCAYNSSVSMKHSRQNSHIG